MRTLNRRFLMALTLIFYVALVYTQSLEEKGLEIAKESEKRDEGFESFSNELTMILKNRHGQETKRHIRGKTLEVKGDGDKTLIIFDDPKDVKGTASMNYTHKEGPDDQWLYLPAIKRVKYISSTNKSGPFMGSEFSFEDLSSQEVEKYTYKYYKEETLNGIATYVVERYPVDPKSGYTRQVVWFNKDNYRVEKIVFYDRKNALLKTLRFKDYKQYAGKFWRPTVMLMVNHQNGKETKLIFKNYKFKIGLTDDDFTQNSLKRAN